MNDDYDWVVFDVTPPNHSCQTLTADGEISCNFSGISGPTGPNGQPGGQNEPPFAVAAGNSYVVCITNWSGSVNGYEVDFSASTANIYVDDMNTVDQDICYGDSAQLRALYTGPTFGTQVYSWGPTDMVVDSTGKNTFSKPIYEDSTIFVVTLTSGECELTDTLLVTTNQFENEFFVDYDNILSPVVVQFTNNSPEDVESYFWDFGNELTSDKRDPTEQLYYEPGKYTAMLVTESLTEDGFSCLDTTYREINVPEYSIPNVITPNGDGMNDKLIITGLKEETNLFIYNRWGIKVDEVTDYHNGWDGGDLKDGSYFYQVTRQDGGVIEGFEGWIDIKR